MTDITPDERIGLRDSDIPSSQGLDLWFLENPEVGHGLCTRVKVTEVLCRYRTRFQDLAIFETERLGRMLVLDNVIMLTEFDEAAYHEMIVHVPLLVHPRPRRVLVIGGGDGGTLREVVKHPGIEEIHVCELDDEVVKACRKFLPSLAGSFDDPRVGLFFEDGARFVLERPDHYDLIIVDSTDPVGPGQVLFQRPFYEGMRRALRKDGMVVTQCESFYLHRTVIRGVAGFAREIFPKLNYYYTLVPTYPSGVIGFMFGSLRHDPLTDYAADRADRLEGLRYYTPEIHRAAFVLPGFARRLFEQG